MMLEVKTRIEIHVKISIFFLQSHVRYNPIHNLEKAAHYENEEEEQVIVEQ